MKKLLPLQTLHLSVTCLLILTSFFRVTVSAADISVEFVDQPLFRIQNMAPGDSIVKQVTLKNNTLITQDVSIKLTKEGGTKSLENVLRLEMRDGTDILKTINLADAFSQSSAASVIALFTLDPESSTALTVKALFDPAADNAYQDAAVTFAMSFAALAGIPSECENIPNLSLPIEGTPKSDRLSGTEGNDLIMGNAGNDIIDGKGGRDCIVAGAGRDIVNGGAGDDVILGQEGNDLLRGGDGNDAIYGNEGMDVLQGDREDDRIIGDPLDILIGGQNKDTCKGSFIKIGCEL